MFKKIEEVSKLSGVSKRTLQYYDDEVYCLLNALRIIIDFMMMRQWKDYGKSYGTRKWG